jgi:hypothetical protein
MYSDLKRLKKCLVWGRGANVQGARSPWRRGNKILYDDAQYAWTVTVELDSYHRPGAQNFYVPSGYVDIVVHP